MEAKHPNKQKALAGFQTGFFNCATDTCTIALFPEKASKTVC